MNVKIIPYTFIDGIRTFKDSEIKYLFNKTVADKLDKIIFYEGTVKTDIHFLNMVKSTSVLFYVLYKDDKNIGYTWLNRFENHTARQHFCIFKEYWGNSIELGQMILKHILNMKDKNGNYIFDLLTGFVPSWNKRAIQFSLKCGGKTHGEIPNAIYNVKTKQSEPAVFIYYTRSEA